MIHAQAPDPQDILGWTTQQPWPHPGPSKKYEISAPGATQQSAQQSARMRKHLKHAAAQLDPSGQRRI